MILQEQSLKLQAHDQLTKLEAADLIQVEQVKPELIYQFKHALLHHAVYTNMDEKEKKKKQNWKKFTTIKLKKLLPNWHTISSKQNIPKKQLSTCT